MESGRSSINPPHWSNSTIQINSLNINGLAKKLVKTADFIKLNSIDILFLQETHLIDKQKVTSYFKQNNLSFFINKTRNQHNNYNGTAFIVNHRIASNYKVEPIILQDNR